jgi:hypothetical protein
MFQRQVIEKIKENISYLIVFSENRALHGARQQHLVARQATADSTIGSRREALCMLGN